MRSITARMSVVALALGAGAAMSARAAEAHQPSVTAAPGPAGTMLTINGAAFRTTRSRVANLRVLSFPGSKRSIAVWDEWTAGAKATYSAFSPDALQVSQVTRVGNNLKLRYAAFDPLIGEPAIPAPFKSRSGNELFLVQLVAAPIDEIKQGLAAAGARVVRYLPDNAFLVRMTPAARQRVAALGYVRWVGAYHPAYKLSEDERFDVLSGDNQPARYSIECTTSGAGPQQVVADAVRRLGGIVELTTPDQYRLEATLTPAQLLAIAGLNEVNFIDAWAGPMGTDMQVVRQLQGAVATLSNAGFTGQGVRGEVYDTEVRTTHAAFQTPPPLLHHGSAGTPPIEYHGSTCYGINFAHWDDFTYYNGLVTDAEQGIFLDYTLSSQYGMLALNTEATDPAGPYRSCYQTSSVGSLQTTQYTTVSAEVDDYLFRIDYLSFQSQSNTGSRSSRPQAWAKNIVSVGGISWGGTLDRSDDSWTGASYGPASDGRQKPDLANCYDSVPATAGDGDVSTTSFGGTSAATPITAGDGGLLMQMWHAGVWHGVGGGRNGPTVFDDRPYSTTAKALLINTAYRYPLTQGGLTRAKQGWGMPDLTNLYTLASKTFIVDDTRPIQQGESARYTLTVSLGEPVLAATLCYIDPTASPAASVQLINDLSLRVTAPDGTTTYWGNAGLNASNVSTPGGSEDHINTVENVFIQNPAAGPWTVEVIGTSIPVDAYPTGRPGVTPTGPTDAAFSLVVSGVQTGAPAPCYANCDHSTALPFLNVNDFICFQTKFAAGDSYANCDGSTTIPVLNVNDFLCFQSRFAAGCSAP